MNLSVPVSGNLLSLSDCGSACCSPRFQPYLTSCTSLNCSRDGSFHCGRFFKLRSLHCLSLRVRFLSKREIACSVTEPQINPDSDNEEVNQVEQDVEPQNSVQPHLASTSQTSGTGQKDNAANSAQISIQNLNRLVKKEEPKASAEPYQENTSQPSSTKQINSAGSSAESSIQNLDRLIKKEEPQASAESYRENTLQPSGSEQIDNAGREAQNSTQNIDSVEVASGSPLPGAKPQQLDEIIQIPKETIDILKDQVFGFDTFFVTSQQPYEGGVLFKGNLRGKAAVSYEKIKERLQDKFEDQYKLFLLINPEDDQPVAVVVPSKTLQPEKTAVPEWFAAGAFGLVTVFTLLLRNVPALQSDLLSIFDNLNLLKDGLPGASVTALVLGVHELAHYLVAKSAGVKLGVPFFVPSWQIGSFGAITRFRNIVSNREDLLKVAAAGPLAGFALGFILLLLGFILPPSDGIGIVLDASVFHESFLLGAIAKLLLGSDLKDGTPISVNPLVLWAWTGLLVNAINSIPAGELDGGRISFAIWGRKTSYRSTSATIVLLAASSLINDVAFYWVVLIFILQRGPIAPLSEEVSSPDNKYTSIGILVLLLGLLVCLPYPFPFTDDTLINL